MEATPFYIPESANVQEEISDRITHHPLYDNLGADVIFSPVFGEEINHECVVMVDGLYRSLTNY